VIDVPFVIGHALWILGAAIALSVASYSAWIVRQRRRASAERPAGHRTGRAARLLAATELPFVLGIAPLLLFPTPTRLWVLLLIAPVWIAARIATGRYVPNTPLNISLAVLLAMVGVSVWVTSDMRLSFGKVIGVLLGVLLFWAVVRWVATPARLRLGIAAFMLAGGALAIIGVLGTHWINKFPMFVPLTAMLPSVIRGVPGAEEGFNPNAVAGCLVLFIPLQCVLLFSGTAKWMFVRRPSFWIRWAMFTAQLFLLALTSGAILLMQSRSAWFGLAVAAVAILMWHARWTRLVIVGLVGVAAVMFGSTIGPRLVAGEPREPMDGMVERVEIWSGALRGIQEFAVTGMGMNTFRRMVPVLAPALVADPDARMPPHAHNHLLQVALDLGIPGLIAYTSTWMLTAWLLVVAYRRCADTTLRAFAAGLGAGLIAHFIFGLTDVIPLGAKVGILFWLAMGLATGCHQIAFCCTASDIRKASPDSSAAAGLC
jgi:putative inorganic carbon (hco3(-)) transporter